MPTLCTFLCDGHYFRVTGSARKLGVASRHSPDGIIEVGKHYTRSGFKWLLAHGRAQEISQEQAIRLQHMLPRAPRLTPDDYAPRKAKKAVIQVYLERITQAEIKALAKRQHTSASRLQREWIRHGLALALDRERAGSGRVG